MSLATSYQILATPLRCAASNTALETVSRTRLSKGVGQDYNRRSVPHPRRARRAPPRGCDLHLAVDIRRSRVERAAEYCRERKDVIDLIGIIAAPGADDGCACGLASSGMISGVGFAQAKIMASRFIVRIMSCVSTPGADTPMNTSAPRITSASFPLLRVRIRHCGDLLLCAVHAGASLIYRAAPVGHDYVLHAA